MLLFGWFRNIQTYFLLGSLNSSIRWWIWWPKYKFVNSMTMIYAQIQWPKYMYKFVNSVDEFDDLGNKFDDQSTLYLSYWIDNQELHTMKMKVEAVLISKNVTELHSFLGFSTTMASFCLTSLHHYINWTDQLWRWMQQCAEVLEAAKYSAPVLTHYDPVLPLKLLGDVSSYSIGAIISHTMPDVVECSVTNSFSKWTQLLADRKEVLSLGDCLYCFTSMCMVTASRS